MLVTERDVEKSTRTLAEVANAFREEAEEVTSSPEEAEILATAALVNFLAKARPELVGPADKIRKAAFVSSLS